jgi:hypothetical protein
VKVLVAFREEFLEAKLNAAFVPSAAAMDVEGGTRNDAINAEDVPTHLKVCMSDEVV